MLGHMQECEGLIKCGSNAMLLVDTEKQVIYSQVFYYYVGHISFIVSFCDKHVATEIDKIWPYGDEIHCNKNLLLYNNIIVLQQVCPQRFSIRIFNYNSVVGSNLECVGFIALDNKVVVVMMNRGNDPITFKLLDELSGGKQAVKREALPHSIQTYVYWLYHCTLGTVMQVRITLYI